MFSFFATLGAAALLSVAGVEIFRRWSLERNVVDVPNERSSHSVPTPRGGGIVIVLIVLIAVTAFSGISGRGLSPGFYIGAVIVAAVSLLDDLRGVSPFVRLGFHSVAAAAVVIGFGGFTGGMMTQSSMWLERGITFVWIVWLINAYNFMDGIDGIAALQAVTAGLGWLAIGLISDAHQTAFLGGLTAAASLGFLVLNWQPAKIFMGDVGSAFLGFVFASLPVSIIRESPSATGWEVFAIGVLLVWMFVFDSVLTFLRRLLRGEKVWQAHREHLYQRLVIAGFSHASVTSLYGVLSTGILVTVLLTVVGGRGIWWPFFVAGLSGIGVFSLATVSKARNKGANT